MGHMPLLGPMGLVFIRVVLAHGAVMTRCFTHGLQPCNVEEELRLFMYEGRIFF